MIIVKLVSRGNLKILSQMGYNKKDVPTETNTKRGTNSETYPKKVSEKEIISFVKKKGYTMSVVE